LEQGNNDQELAKSHPKKNLKNQIWRENQTLNPKKKKKKTKKTLQ
jgi:hypothetical protein